MKNIFKRPDWVPKLPDGQKILITGATGGLGKSLVEMLLKESNCIIGAHGFSKTLEVDDKRVMKTQKELDGEYSCKSLITWFLEKAGGLDALVVLNGSIKYSGHWKQISELDWERELCQNLSIPFFLARETMKEMIKGKTGGKILLTGTESSLHGGSDISFPYAIAKRGTECMVQGLAREGAEHNILVNGLRLGYFKSGFHQRWHNKTPKDMEERERLVLLKRGGEPDEATSMMIYLLSGYGDFITGQMIPLTGGDWL